MSDEKKNLEGDDVPETDEVIAHSADEEEDGPCGVQFGKSL